MHLPFLETLGPPRGAIEEWFGKEASYDLLRAVNRTDEFIQLQQQLQQQFLRS